MSKQRFVPGEPVDLVGIDLMQGPDGAFQLEEIEIRNARVDDYAVSIRFEIKRGKRWSTAAVSITHQLGKASCEEGGNAVFGRVWGLADQKRALTQALVDGCLGLIDARIERLQSARTVLAGMSPTARPNLAPKRPGP